MRSCTQSSASSVAGLGLAITVAVETRYYDKLHWYPEELLIPEGQSEELESTSCPAAELSGKLSDLFDTWNEPLSVHKGWQPEELKEALVNVVRSKAQDVSESLPCDQYLASLTEVIAEWLLHPDLFSIWLTLTPRRTAVFGQSFEIEHPSMCSTDMELLTGAATILYSLYADRDFPADWMAGSILCQLHSLYPGVEFNYHRMKHTDPNRAGQWSVESILAENDPTLMINLPGMISALATNWRRKKITYTIYRCLPDNLERSFANLLKSEAKYLDLSYQDLKERTRMPFKKLLIAHRLFQEHFNEQAIDFLRYMH